MMGEDGLRKASEISLLSANWLAHKIDPDFKVLYKAKNGRVAHECIFDCRSLPVTAEDVAKRLMDYGFHAPTLSWPVSNTMMVEPTESESLDELQRFVDAMAMIRREIFTNKDILKNAPHTARMIAGDWDYNYTPIYRNLQPLQYEVRFSRYLYPYKSLFLSSPLPLQIF